MKKCLIYTSLLLLLSLCSQKYDLEKTFFQSALNDYPDLENKYKAYIILPPSSCVPCNNYSVDMSINMLKKRLPVRLFFECFPENYYVLLFKLQKISYENKDVIIDTLLKYRLPDNKWSDLPVVLFVNKNKIKKLSFQSSHDPHVFEKLFKLLE